MSGEKDRDGGPGHPLPASEEAGHDRLPEHVEAEKGLGDDPAPRVQPAGDPVDPDGDPYELPDEATEL
ncbi:MAG TPA: hypothetical protein VEC11_00250 [Allosphingosinicella sp.]|nr:hypothetical protein [Allosphingosinicella sp.]